MELFDTHFHWYGKPEPEVIILEASENEVKYLLNSGWNLESSTAASQFAESFENCWFSAGVHPHNASDFNFDFTPFKDLSKQEKCKAIGEVGLDYFYENSDKKSQLKVFEKFTEFALATDQPLVIHCRDKDDKFDTYNETYNIISDFVKNNGTFAIHCYTGNGHWLEKFLELGGYIGITGIITFPKASNIRDIIHLIPNNRLLLETDSPYLAPKPHRGKTNFPKYLPEVAKAVAKEKEIPIDNLAEFTTKNAFTFFKIS